MISQETTSVGEDVERREPSYTALGVQTGAATMENIKETP